MHNRICSGTEKSCPRNLGDNPAQVKQCCPAVKGKKHEQQKGCCVLDQILLWFGSTLISWLGKSQAHRIIQPGSDLGGSLVQPRAQSRVSCEIRPGCPWLLPVRA